MVESTHTRILLDTADLLRRNACTLMAMPAPDRMVFSVGVSVLLDYVFAARHVRSLLLLCNDYFGEDNFGYLPNTEAVPPERFLAAVYSGSFDAVLVSIVSHTGRLSPVAEWFQAIRRTMGPRCPLLVADASHIGALGFPPLGELNADWICGDLAKWLAPIGSAKVGFGWTPSAPLFDKVRPVFKRYFLALSESRLANQSSFVWPEHVVALSAIYQQWVSTEKNPKDWHARNLRIAQSLGVGTLPPCSIVRIPPADSLGLPESLFDSGLASRLEDGSVRVLCRSDLWPTRSADALHRPRPNDTPVR